MKLTAFQPGYEYPVPQPGEYLHVVTGDGLRVRLLKDGASYLQKVARGGTINSAGFDSYTVENTTAAAQDIEIETGYGTYTAPVDGGLVEVTNTASNPIPVDVQAGAKFERKAAASAPGIADQTVLTGATVEISANDPTFAKTAVIVAVISGSVRVASNAAADTGTPLSAGDTITLDTYGAVDAYGVSDAVVAVTEVK